MPPDTSLTHRLHSALNRDCVPNGPVHTVRGSCPAGLRKLFQELCLDLLQKGKGNLAPILLVRHRQEGCACAQLRSPLHIRLGTLGYAKQWGPH